MADCIFCQICDGKIPSTILYQDDRVVAFRDVNPQAPLHALVVPRRHVATLLDLAPADNELVGHLFQVAARLAREAGVASDGFRAVFNCNRGAGQTVFHIHLHLLGGRTLTWPPG